MSTVGSREYYAIQYRLDAEGRWHTHASYSRRCAAPSLYLFKARAEYVARRHFSGPRYEWRVISVHIPDV